LGQQEFVTSEVNVGVVIVDSSDVSIDSRLDTSDETAFSNSETMFVNSDANGGVVI